jgi:hypothetical protein
VYELVIAAEITEALKKNADTPSIRELSLSVTIISVLGLVVVRE